MEGDFLTTELDEKYEGISRVQLIAMLEARNRYIEELESSKSSYLQNSEVVDCGEYKF